MNRRLLSLLALTTLASLGLVFVSPADAVSTRHFLLDDAEGLAAGELEGTMVLSTGEVVVGAQLARIGLENAALATSVARASDGALYVGTGNAGKIFRVRGDEVRAFAETGQLLVTSLVIEGGTLYAGTLPEGRIYAINLADGAVREHARPEGAEHVWALVHDGRRLFAGTGPEGKVFAIDPSGNAELYFDSDEAHVLSLAREGDRLYAGTSERAIVYRLRGPGRAEVVHDFPGNEIAALSARGGVLAVLANDMPAARPVAATKAKRPTASEPPRPGKGRLFRVDAEGRVERLHHDDGAHFTAVRIAADGTIYVGVGKDGRVLRVSPDRVVATYADVDERQVLDLDVDGDRPVFVTGDSGTLHRVLPGAASEAFWTSKVLDASFSARFGQLTWRGSGRVQLQTRTGNSGQPDATWTEWSQPITTPGPIRSAGGRFLQIRAKLLEPTAVIRAVQAYYLPQNQRPTVTRVGLKATKQTKREASAPEPSTTYDLEWSVDNPDEDAIRYRLRYRAEDQTIWRPVFREDVRLTKAEYRWETSGLPDGWYVVEVEASDELSNPSPLVLRSTRTSSPILVDNHPPRVEGLAFRGGRVTGRAVDGFGPIVALEVAVDGGDWLPAQPDDGLLDTRDERFTIPIEGLTAGSHVVAVRAYDAGGNSGSAELVIDVR
ncbi:MAG: hypothetical protein KF901_03730 [Myxococcales bacterium]|nr:hypothetical protein [Myxococcales bacterium]